jgi:LuxR family maltose regulon positive regulatory protein
MVTGLASRVIYELGDFAAAEIAILDDFDLIETTAFHESFLQSFLVLARVSVIRGDTARALSLLNRAERLAWERGWGRVVAMLLHERMRILLDQGALEEAGAIVPSLAQLASAHPAPARCSWSEIHVCYAAGQGLAALAGGAPEEAASHLSRAYADLLSAHDRIGALRIGIELAVALGRSGASTRAHEVLREVLHWSQGARFVSFILERGATAGRLLVSAKERGAFSSDRHLAAFAADLIARIDLGGISRNGPPSSEASPALTERERSIVHFIADGQSNKEIARQLGVAPETVKTHLKRIFHKLSAETRAQAVVRAQSLGLLRSAAGKT